MTSPIVHLSEWRQGDVFDIGSFEYTDLAADDDTSLAQMSQPGVRLVLLTQTCDVVRSPTIRSYVIAAPLVELSGSELQSFQKGASPRYVHVPGVGDSWFGELDSAMTLTKSLLVTRNRTPGLRTNRERRDFKQALGRKFTRIALPNHIDAALKPLQKVVRDKHKQEASAEGRRLRELQEIRIEVDPDDDWFSDTVEITLAFVVKTDVLPSKDPESLTPSDEIVQWYEARGRERHEICEKLERVGFDDDIMWLWQKLADSWASLSVVGGLVVSIHGEAVSAQRYGIDRMAKSEELDLDYLTSDEP